MPDAPACQICGGSALHDFPRYAALRRVTSDCRPWPAGGRLCVCTACGTAQKVADAEWQAEIGAIYDTYAVYHQGGGAEQLVFAGGAGTARSDRIVERFLGAAALPEEGEILDIGCGNGAFLAAFAARRPGWGLHGAELDDRNRALLERIPGFRALHVGDARGIGRRFDAVVMIHALEHIPDPVGMLRAVRENLLAEGGHLLIEVPNHRTNPFDLLIADHITHFSPRSLGLALARAGFAPSALDDAWVPKELTAVAHAADVAPPEPDPAEAAAAVEAVSAGLAWLEEVATAARRHAAARRVGLFGTSIAAGWLAGELGDRVAFFVDEDPNRVGRSYLDQPILAPASVPDGAEVLVPLAGRAAGAVAARLGSAGRRYLPLPDGPRFAARAPDNA